VETLVRQPQPEQAGANGAAPADLNGHGGQTPPEPPVVAETPVRTCKACGAGMIEAQDWCLECGTARPGRLGTRPGWRAAATVSGATLMLVCGAVAASYAAITDDAGKQADKPVTGNATPIAGPTAQVPPAVAPTPTPGAALPTTSTPAITTGSTTSALPKLPTLPANSTSTPSVSTPTSSTTTTTSTQTTTTTTTTDTTPTTPALTAITLAADSADVYDPYPRATDKGDPADAYDANAKDSWFVQTAADGKPMQVGLLVDLESRKNVKQIEFATNTPGFRVEVYTTDGSALPPDILDTRWAHVASRSDVDQNTKGDNVKGDDKEIVALPKGGEEARKLVLWFTTPPDAGATVRLRDLVLKG